MFHINKKKLLLEEKENGTANISFYSGQCLTCEYSPDRENRAACPKADFFAIKSGRFKIIKHLCASWLLCSTITSCFKKNQSPEIPTIPPQNGKSGKFPKYK